MLGFQDFSIERLGWENPWAFVLLLMLPLWLVWYARYQTKTLKSAFYYSPIALLKQLKQDEANSWQWAYPVWVVGLLLLLIFSTVRPVLVGSLPVHQVNLMLVMDISLSMMADDIEPDRIEAAKKAAMRFVDSLPADVQVGLELFAGNNYVVQPPSKDHEAVTSYIKGISHRHLQMRTEIGSALKTAVDVLSAGPLSSNDKIPASKNRKKPRQVVILMSDGDSQEGYPWSSAVALARRENIIINTVGIGSTGEATIVYRGHRVPVFFNENTLRQIAIASSGQYFRVFKEADFEKVYEQIKQQSIVMTRKKEEITWLVSWVAMLWLILGLSIPVLKGRY